jgi:hypothetical protein
LALSRLKIRRDLIYRQNKPTQYLDGLIDERDKWAGHWFVNRNTELKPHAA